MKPIMLGKNWQRVRRLDGAEFFHQACFVAVRFVAQHGLAIGSNMRNWNSGGQIDAHGFHDGHATAMPVRRAHSR
jgi:hypothetical protein